MWKTSDDCTREGMNNVELLYLAGHVYMWLEPLYGGDIVHWAYAALDCPLIILYNKDMRLSTHMWHCTR